MEDFYRVDPFKRSVDSRPRQEIKTLKYSLVACCGGPTGHCGTAGRVPGEGGRKDRIGIRLGSCGLEGGGEEEEGWEE